MQTLIKNKNTIFYNSVVLQPISHIRHIILEFLHHTFKHTNFVPLHLDT